MVGTQFRLSIDAKYANIWSLYHTLLRFYLDHPVLRRYRNVDALVGYLDMSDKSKTEYDF